MDRQSLGRAPEGGDGTAWVCWVCWVGKRALARSQWVKVSSPCRVLVGSGVRRMDNHDTYKPPTTVCVGPCWPMLALARFFAKPQLSTAVCLAKSIFGCYNPRFWTLERHFATSQTISPLCVFSPSCFSILCQSFFQLPFSRRWPVSHIVFRI